MTLEQPLSYRTPRHLAARWYHLTSEGHGALRGIDYQALSMRQCSSEASRETAQDIADEQIQERRDLTAILCTAFGVQSQHLHAVARWANAMPSRVDFLEAQIPWQAWLCVRAIEMTCQPFPRHRVHFTTKHTAELAGVARQTMYRWLKKCDQRVADAMIERDVARASWDRDLLTCSSSYNRGVQVYRDPTALQECTKPRRG